MAVGTHDLISRVTMMSAESKAVMYSCKCQQNIRMPCVVTKYAAKTKVLESNPSSRSRFPMQGSIWFHTQEIVSNNNLDADVNEVRGCDLCTFFRDCILLWFV